MEKIALQAQIRDLKAASPSKLRSQGLLPVNLYGHKVKNQNLVVKAAEFDKVFKKAGESTIVSLTTEDGKTHPVLIHETQRDVLTSKPIHVDFFEVSMTEKLKAKVVLDFIGESKAVKEQGGVLVKNITEIEVECLPNDLPHNIPVSITLLQTFSDAIHAKNLKLPDKVLLLTNPDEVVAKVQPPRSIEVEAVAEVSEADKVAEVIAASTEAKEAKDEEAEEAPAKPAKDEKKEAKKE